MNVAAQNGAVRPLVTVAIPVLNEEPFIDACLESLVSGDYPADSMEVLVVDGGSTDRSLARVESWKDRLPLLRVLHNPDRIQSAALNIAIKEATGEYFVRLDAHSTYQPHHVSLCVDALSEGKADNVGGVQWPVGTSGLQKAIALTLRSPFSMGPSAHRHSSSPRYGESVYLGAWKTETLRELGGFDESLKVAEDYELNIRLRELGKRVLVVPDLACLYNVRSSLPALTKQYFRYGMWKTRILRRYPKALKPRHTAPGLLLLGLIGSLILLPFVWQIAIILPLVYAAFLLLATATVVTNEKSALGFGSLIAFPLIHLSYGTGFFWGLVGARRSQR